MDSIIELYHIKYFVESQEKYVYMMYSLVDFLVLRVMISYYDITLTSLFIN
jgi:hypothetical protein